MRKQSRELKLFFSFSRCYKLAASDHEMDFVIKLSAACL